MKPRNIVIILLAAGGARRMGGPKQLLLYQGTTLIRHLAKMALDSRAAGVAVVIGAYSDRIEPEIASLPVRIIRNDDWESGIGGSLARAVQTVRHEADALLFTASDQPLVTTPVLNTIIETFRSSPNRIVASEYAGTLGIPAIFPKQFFDELAALSGDHGAKKVILRHRSTVTPVPFPDGAVDVDLLTDLKKLI